MERVQSQVDISGNSLPSIRPILYLVLAVTAAIIGTLFADQAFSLRNSEVLVPTGLLCVAIFLWNTYRAATGLLKLVFVLLALHVVVGFLLAPTALPWMVSGTLDDRAFSLSLVVVAAGLMVASCAFRLAAPSRGWLPQVDNQKLIRLAEVMTVMALACLLYGYHRNELLPWQADFFRMDVLRYRISGVDEWLINRSMDVLMLTVPLLLLFDGAAKVFSLVGALGLAITFKRAPILDVVLVAALASVIRSGKLRKLLVTVGVLFCLYAASQIFYHGFLRGEIAPEDVYDSMASGFPEVRDLGWILWLNGRNLHWGTTLVQAVLPVPSFASPWIQENSLRALTTRMIGFDWEDMGGLRLTLAGEGYLNFGMVGTLLLCALWGCGMRKVGGVIQAAEKSSNVVHAYFAALLLCWLAFWLYLGGSQASGVVRSSALLLAGMLWICRAKDGAGARVK